MMRIIYNRSGFTLVELLIAVLISAMVMGGVWTVYLMCLTSWEQGSTQVALQRDAAVIMEKMIRGVDGTNGIREAVSVDTSVLGRIDYTSGVDGVERTFYVSGDDILYDPVTSDPLDGDPIATNPGGITLTFSLNNDVVTIFLNMQWEVSGETMPPIIISTRVNLRN